MSYFSPELIEQRKKEVKEMGPLHEKICQRYAETFSLNYDDAPVSYIFLVSGGWFDQMKSLSDEQLLRDRQKRLELFPSDRFYTVFYNLCIDIILEERQAARQEAARRLKEQEENRLKEMASDIANNAVEAAVKVILEDQKKKEMLLKKEAEEKILAIQRENELLMKQKDEIIQKFKEAAENYKKAYEALKTSIDFTHLTEQFLHLAQANQYYLALIKEMKNPLDPLLFRAASTGDFESAKAAIRLGADVNVQDHMLDTPLHKAAAADEIAIIRLLLVNGCDPNKANIAGKTANELTENKEIIKLINGYKNPAIQPALSTNCSALFYKGQTPAVDSGNVQPNYTPNNIH